MGFGGAMTGSAAFVIFHHEKRDQIMSKLFAPLSQGGIGISTLRIPVSLLSDFMPQEPYTYTQKNDYTLGTLTFVKIFNVYQKLFRSSGIQSTSYRF